MNQLIDDLRLRLRAIEAGHDPATRAWVADMRSRVSSGEIDKLLADQPHDPRDLIDRRRSAAS